MKSLLAAFRIPAALLLLIGCTSPAVAQFEEGVDYLEVPLENPGEGKIIEVLEFFYYGCPHCERLEPDLVRWKKDLPEDVRFERIPPPLNPRWTLFARAYYAAEALGVAEKGHQAMFDAMHHQDKTFKDRDDLADFYARYGADRDTFLTLMDDFNLDRTKIRRGMGLAHRYGLQGVPTLVIDGRWRTSPSIAGGNERVLQVVDYLIGKAREARSDARQ